MFTIMGATGNTGGAAAKRLLSEGAKVRAVGRSREKLAMLESLGAEIAVGDANDAAFLTTAFKGAEGVYAMIGADYSSVDPIGDYQRAAASLKSAVKASGISRLVVLSGLGAEQASGTGPVVGLHHLEKALASTGVDQLVLRPGYYFENFFGALPMIRAMGINGGVHDPDRPVAMVATQDVGRAAADALTSGSFRGVEVREIYVEPKLTMRQATQILGAAIGKPDLAYVHFAGPDYIAGLTGAGVSKELARLLVEMGDAFNQGKLAPQQSPDAKNHSLTSFASFVPALAGAYAAGA